MSVTHKKWLILLAVALSISITTKILILDNTNFLYAIAEGMDQPSKPYYFVMERIYKLSGDKKLDEKIHKFLEEDKNKHLHALYIHTLGIIGGNHSSTFLMKAYVKYQDDPNHIITVSRIIDSMGVVGDEDVVPILERLIDNYDNHRMKVTRYAIVRALYLATGKVYEYINSSGKNTKLKLTDELESARGIILAAKGRTRTFEEMRSLDKLFKPPSW